MKDLTKLLLAVALAIVCGACGGANQGMDATADTESDGEAAADERDQKAVPVYREVTIPAGTTMQLDLASSVTSDQSRIEDPVRATFRQPVVIDGQTAIPVGAELAGVVTNAQESGRVKGRARIAFRFDALTVGDEQYDINTQTISRLAPATKGEDAKKIGIGAGAGAAVGAILGGGSGAAKGAAIGGAGGTGVVLATKGQEVRLGPGANVATKLTAPLTVRIYE